MLEPPGLTFPGVGARTQQLRSVAEPALDTAWEAR
jgi:hypothetical protein